MPTSEAKLVSAIVKQIEKRYPGCWTTKIVGGPYQATGIPDLLLCVQGRFIGLEIKFQRPGESRQHALSRATPGQLMQIRRINRAGGTAAVVTSVEEAIEVIEETLRSRPRMVENLPGVTLARELLGGLSVDGEN